ncbi:MAG: hemolysin III family protein, partial [Lachnospiraceae bacterium]|nr:hemolysin III family protein [Lachnospiraceae bacterium]
MSKAISIPKYSFSEELISSISHGIGAGLAISACVLGVIKAARDIDSVGTIGIVSAAIFGATMIMLYCMSAIYHALPVGDAKRVFRVIDHCSVFLLIAGTYTPYALVSLHGALGWTVFGVIWGLTALGITFNAI